jgi:sigma-B regulation protein RsbU (phosphoserine phosphatase)
VAEVLAVALDAAMDRVQAGRGCLYLRDEDGRDRLGASRGAESPAPAVAELGSFAPDAILLRESGERPELFGRLGAELLCPLSARGRTVAVLALGLRADGRGYGPEEAEALRAVAATAAAAIENSLVQDELRRLNQRLSVKVYQLRNLFDIGRELTAKLDERSIAEFVTTTLMGHLLVSRSALYLEGPEGLRLAHERGVGARDRQEVPAGLAAPYLAGLAGPKAVGELPPGPVRERLERTRMAVVVPVGAERTRGLLAAGERASGVTFGEEDLEFAQALGRQAIAALETVRLHGVRVEKERQDRDLQLAREIQQSLLPKEWPEAPGFEFAAASEPCYEVGGDYYDLIPLGGGRVALVVADVSGKGTPASILMASVHAFVRALAGTAPLDVLLQRLNGFLFENTQAGRYVTAFYAELDAAARRMRYVSAGHVPPYRLARGGRRERLHVGGPALGLIEGAAFTVCELPLEPGDVLVVVTDGATEAPSPADVEFGDEGVFVALESHVRLPAADVLRGVLGAVRSWTAPAKCADDLTALVVKTL